MNNIIKLKKSPVIAFIIILCLIVSMYSSYAYLHVHVLSNGAIIYHSHSYSQTTNNQTTESNKQTNHNHNRLELIYFHLISVLSKLFLFF